MCNCQVAIGGVMKTQGNIEASDEAYEQALQIARTLKDKKLVSKCLINISSNLRSRGDYVGAVQQLQEAINIVEEIDDKQLQGSAFGTMASIYRMQGNYAVALEYYLKTLRLNEQTNNSDGVITNLVNIAGIQHDQNEFDAALETLNKALKKSEEKGDSVRISICYTNIGNVYKQMNNPEALGYFQKALKISKDYDVAHNVNNHLNIGSIYTDRGDFANAMKSFDEALTLAQKANLRSSIGEVYVKMGTLYFAQKKYSMAMEYIQKALDIAQKIRYNDLQKDCNQLLSEINATIGNYKDAYAYHVEYKTLYDSIFNEKTTRKIALLESSYKFEKERQLYELEKSGRELRIKSQQQAILLLVVTSLLILLLSIAVYRSGRLKKRVLELEIENINKELEANQKIMAVAKLKLIQNSERDLHNVKMLEDIGKSTVGDGQKNLSSLISNYKIQTNHSNWEEFETLFTKINTSFWDKLSELNPNLTPNERKLCAFLKLNMSNKDIMLITFQTEDALKKSRLRLRKKFDLDRSINLTAFINNL